MSSDRLLHDFHVPHRVACAFCNFQVSRRKSRIDRSGLPIVIPQGPWWPHTWFRTVNRCFCPQGSLNAVSGRVCFGVFIAKFSCVLVGYEDDTDPQLVVDIVRHLMDEQALSVRVAGGSACVREEMTRIHIWWLREDTSESKGLPFPLPLKKVRNGQFVLLWWREPSRTWRWTGGWAMRSDFHSQDILFTYWKSWIHLFSINYLIQSGMSVRLNQGHSN